MICKPCRAGGDVSRGLRLGHIGRYGNPDAPREMAESLHAECKGCDCQHRVNVGPPPLVTDENGRALRDIHEGEWVRIVLPS